MALKAFIEQRYSVLTPKALEDDLVDLLKGNRHGGQLAENLCGRLFDTRQSQERANLVYRDIFSPTEAFKLVLDLQMPKRRNASWRFLYTDRLALGFHQARTRLAPGSHNARTSSH